MAFAEKYVSQVALLLEVIPFVANEKCFALKGGTAINMFYQDLPRLSVDLDLVYLPLESREESYAHINEALSRIADRLGNGGYAVSLQGNSEKKIIVSNQVATVKIEPNYTIRGSVHEPEMRSVSPRVNEHFGYAKMNVLAREELYAGKLCAVLDRQHPRDLFDVKLMFEKFGSISDEMLSCFIVYALGHNRPLHELLDCVVKDNSVVFEKEFKGMTDSDVSYPDLIEILYRLKNELKKRLVPCKEFLLGFVQLQPDFSIFPYKNVADFPAVKWKMQNLENLSVNNKEKFYLQYQKLNEYFSD